MITTLRLLALLVTALLSGTSWGIWIGFNPVHFTATTYLEQQQSLVLSLNKMMIAMAIFATIVTLILAFLLRKNRTLFVAYLVAALCFIACIIISRFGNLPIQNMMLDWKSDTLPANWTELRDQWWKFHQFRTIAELIALLVICWASLQCIVKKDVLQNPL